MSKFVELPPQDYDRNAFDAFASQHGHFDLGDARAMMWMAQLSYETGAPQTIVQIAPLWGFKPIPHFRAQGQVIDTRAIIGERDDCTVVAFAGTDPALARNLITDADCRLTASDTHEGFQDAFDAVWPLIESKIRAGRPPLFFTGHSFGAALAVLAAEKAHDIGIAPAAVYTFGMPRAGGRSFAARYDGKLGDRSFRLVRGGDIVACVPEWIEHLAPPARVPFQHVGRMLKCDSGGKFDRNRPLSAMSCDDSRFGAGVRENWTNRVSAALAGKLLAAAGPGVLGPLFALLPFAIRDHLPDRYLSALTP